MNKVTALAMTLEPLEYQAAHGALTSERLVPKASSINSCVTRGAALAGEAPSLINHGLSDETDLSRLRLNRADKALEKSLQAMGSHNLAQQNGSALMDRIDTKYLISRDKLPDLLKALSLDYSVLCENDKRVFTYETTYFDTPNKHFYHAHHNGHLNRRKVRFRRYVDSNIGFMEVKLKNNKGRTIKKRVPMDCVRANDESVKEFVGQCLVDNSGSQESKLNTTLFVNYRRITLMNKHHQERLTIDVDLHFQCSQSNKSRKLEGLFIVEVKRQAKQQPSSFSKAAKQLALRPVKFSKYCMGLALTDDGALKTNRFKQILFKVEKMATLARISTQINNKNIIGEK